jgi:hypothetical protein
MFVLYELCLRQRSTSLSAEASAWKLKLKLLYGMSTMEHDMEKQCRSRLSDAVVMDRRL